MDVQLREREVDAVLGEFLVDAFVEPMLDLLVVLGEEPHAELDLDRAVLQLAHIDLGIFGAGRVSVQDLGLVLDELQQDLADLVHVRAVGDVELEAEPVRVTRTVVVDVAVGEFAVGDRDLAVVGGNDLRVHDADLRHTAEDALRVDEIADFEGLESQQDEASGEVLHGAAHRHADGHAAGCEQRGDGGGVDAERADHGEDQHDPKGGADQALDERGDGLVGLAFLEGLGEDLLNLADQPGADDVDGDGEQDLEAEGRDGREGPFEELVLGRGLEGLDELRALGGEGLGGEGLHGGGLEGRE